MKYYVIFDGTSHYVVDEIDFQELVDNDVNIECHNITKYPKLAQRYADELNEQL